MKRCISFLLANLFLILSGCGAPTVGDVGAARQFFAMDTPMQITVYGANQEEAADAVLAEINRLEQLMSRTRTDSQISALNAAAGEETPIPLHGEVFSLLAQCKEDTRRTGGAFDITVAPVMDAWGFAGAVRRVPAQEELAGLLPLVDSDGLLLDEAGQTARLARPGMSVDLGAVAKGYAADRAVTLLRSYDVESALLSLGGNITALGTRYDGQPWQVAVRDPRDEGAYLCVLPLQDVTASTSGGYERFFEEDGTVYHHIIDPSTGRPAHSGLLSVTVISPEAALNDAYSTALFVMGAEKALALWREAESFEAILVREDGSVLITEGLEEGLDFRGGENGYHYEIVRR